MKASERLRELDGAMKDYLPDPLVDLDARPSAERSAIEVLEALPLIADVVEAAEAVVVQYRPVMSGTVMSNQADALTALRDALQEGQDSSPPPPEGATAP